MTPAYINCIKGKFEAMRNSGELAPGLVNPTRAAIRDECLRLYPTRSAQKDQATLADFFKHDKTDGTLLETIDRVDLEDLKALQNFLSRGTSRPNYRVVEMLAWLIDFQPRPYNSNVNYSKIELDVPEPKLVSAIGDSKKPPPTEPLGSGKGDHTTDYGPGKTNSPERRRKIIAIAMIILIAGLTVFAFLKGGKKSDECMYWTGDHYVASSCIHRGGDTVVTALDTDRLRNFRRITDTTLITRNSIGKVWYRKKNKNYEFYTSKGYHPIDIQINLRRLTENSYEDFLKSQHSDFSH